MKRAELKMTLGRPIYGWSDVVIQNPTNKKRNVKIDHSYVFPFYDNFQDALKKITFKKSAEFIIEEEGPETLIRLDNLGKDVKITINKIYCKKKLRNNYSYYFKPFSFICNKSKLKRDYKTILIKHFIKNKVEYNHEYFDWNYGIEDIRKIKFK